MSRWRFITVLSQGDIPGNVFVAFGPVFVAPQNNGRRYMWSRIVPLLQHRAFHVIFILKSRGGKPVECGKYSFSFCDRTLSFFKLCSCFCDKYKIIHVEHYQ